MGYIYMYVCMYTHIYNSLKYEDKQNVDRKKGITTVCSVGWMQNEMESNDY